MRVKQNHTTVLSKLAPLFQHLGVIELEKKIAPHLIADILITTGDGKHIVVEYQNSCRDSHYIIGKTTKYSQYGLYCGWIFNTDLLSTKQVTEVFITYGGIAYFYDVSKDILMCNDKILLTPQQYMEKKIDVEDNLIYNKYSYEDVVERVAASRGFQYNREDFIEPELSYEYSKIIDDSADIIMTQYSKIALRTDIVSYLNIGLKRAYFSLATK